MSEWVIGIIGVSGLYALDALEDAQWIEVVTPWGQASDALLLGRLHGIRFAFLPRHGRGHVIPPSCLDFRANIDALKRVGCTDIVAISAIGSLREALPPGRFVVVDQFIDRTVGRTSSFFGPGLTAHVSMADPVCPRLAGLAAAAAEAAGAEVTRGGCYLAMEGPAFSTRAESHMYRSWGCDVIGMTAMPEAKLAREAELPYALVGMVTDYDCWREEEEPVEASTVIARLNANAATARGMIEQLALALPAERSPSPIDNVLDRAIITPSASRRPEMLAKLDAIGRRLFGAG